MAGLPFLWQSKVVIRASDVVKAAVGAGPGPLLKALGFRKKGLVFKRAHGETAQSLAFQLSRANFSSDGSFFVNVGITVGALRPIVPDPVSQSQLAVGGEPMDFGARLKELVADAPAVWNVDDATNASELGERICRALRPLLDILERADGPKGILAAFPLDSGFRKTIRAQLRYVSGDPTGALEDMKAVAREFAGRPGCSLSELLTSAGLTALVEV